LKIDAIVLCKDDFGRSKGYGFIQFSNADDAKKAMEQLNNFELANRPIKVAPFIEKPIDTGAAIANLDNDELDRAGVNLGPSGKLALMAKLAEGSGMRIPQYTLDAITASANATAAAAAAAASLTNHSNNQDQIDQNKNGISAAPQATQCFLLSNMFDLAE
jgi:RNA-binding protein 39